MTEALKLVSVALVVCAAVLCVVSFEAGNYWGVATNVVLVVTNILNWFVLYGMES